MMPAGIGLVSICGFQCHYTRISVDSERKTFVDRRIAECIIVSGGTLGFVDDSPPIFAWGTRRIYPGHQGKCAESLQPRVGSMRQVIIETIE